MALTYLHLTATTSLFLRLSLPRPCLICTSARPVAYPLPRPPTYCSHSRNQPAHADLAATFAPSHIRNPPPSTPTRAPAPARAQ
ncbi:uncharacterized protein K452DRAFT_290005 [Aplosporella prunicola CBS 121167]|uniref:Uncharacterized protein n=1 Tax=Aplosporella prunicola CBS 121167 TaxID=1176127 RepID=A0A6A6B5P7_9PEZI|nr:uncharacterized protein K452DRAFT_290005 [Aplosporella prunicola CBS 121167]KAF2139449.1 hypothetical protein K452DRAFT_290005 [Aplosporella prunicola CBS 121167]